VADDDRPQYQHGLGTIGGTEFHWGSGTPGKYWSIPYGDYPVTPDAPTGAWAQSVGAIPIANNIIPDPLLHRNRVGIMIHSGSADSLDQLYTQGCFKVAPSEWPGVRSQILAEAKKGPLYLHIAPGGVAAFTNTKTFSQAGEETPAANANAAANTTAAPSRVATATPIPGGSSHADFIRDYAKQIGLDPNLALGIANAEGLRAWSASNPNAASTVDVENGQPFSFGDFQLNVHPGAMGAKALAAGIDPRDPKQWQAADRFALDQMKAVGVSPWKGDPVAKAYLASGAVPEATGPIDPSIIAHGGTSPPIPGTTINAPPAAVASTQGVLPGFTTKAASDDFTKNATALDKAIHGDQGPGEEEGKAAAFNFLPARNVSPLIPPAGSGMVSPETYGTTLAGMMAPPQWGSAPPGQMYGAAAGGAPIGQQFGTQLGSIEQMRQMMAMMGSPYGDSGYG
jgi:hypothetical protein